MILSSDLFPDQNGNLMFSFSVELNANVANIPTCSINITNTLPVSPKQKPTPDISLLNDSDRNLLSPINFAPSSALAGKGDKNDAKLSDGEDIVAGSFINPLRSRANGSSLTNNGDDVSRRKSSNINKDLSVAFKYNLHNLSGDRPGFGQTIEEVPTTLEATTSYGVLPKRGQLVEKDEDENFHNEYFDKEKNVSPIQRLETAQDDKPESLAEVLEEQDLGEIEEETFDDGLNFEEEIDEVLDNYEADNIDSGRKNLAHDDDLQEFKHVDEKDIPELANNVISEETAPDVGKRASFRNMFAYSQEFSDNENANYAKTKDAKKQDDDFYDSDFELSLKDSNR